MPFEMLLLIKWTTVSPFFLKSHIKQALIVLKLARTYKFCYQCGPRVKKSCPPLSQRKPVCLKASISTNLESEYTCVCVCVCIFVYACARVRAVVHVLLCLCAIECMCLCECVFEFVCACACVRMCKASNEQV